MRCQQVLVMSPILVLSIATMSHATPRNPLSTSDDLESHGPSSMGGLVGYSDHADWVAVAGPTTLMTFESFSDGTEITTQLPCVDLVTGSSPNAPGPVSVLVTASTSLPFPMFVAGTLPTEPNFLSNDLSPQAGYSTGETTFHLSGLATAIGAYVADQSMIGDRNIEVFVGNFSLGSVTLPTNALPNSFVGIASPVPFNKATFRSLNTADSWGLDNVEHDCMEPTPTESGSWGSVKASYR